MESQLDIPKGVSVSLEDRVLSVKGPKGEVKMDCPKTITISIDKSAVKIIGGGAMAGTYTAHLENAFRGVVDGHRKQAKILYSHFPMKAEVKGQEVHIKNFLGGKVTRVAGIVGSSKVKIKGQDIDIEGPDAYAVGQTAANLQQATKIRKKDKRIFQDGIYVV